MGWLNDRHQRAAMTDHLGREAAMARAEAATLDAQLYVTESRLAALEIAQDNQGWERLGAAGGTMTRSELAQQVELSRHYAKWNPLIKRGVRMRSEYVMGQGYTLTSADEPTQQVLDRLVAYGKNKQVLFGHSATLELARQLDVDGTVALALVPNLATGDVAVRVVPVDQLTEVHTNPEDSAQPWYYRRERTLNELTPAGRTTRTVVELHPAWDYLPPVRPPALDGITVRWDQPMLLARTGADTGLGLGLPDTAAALSWALAYKRFLEDFASLARALSQFAYKVTTKRGGVAAAKAKLGTSLGVGSNGPDSNPRPPSGAAFVRDNDAIDIEPISKTGATLDIDSGKPLRLMVGAALDLPDTIMTGDADQGSLATAHSLDRPTELAMGSRQQLWGEVFTDVATYALWTAIRAGVMPGAVSSRADGTVRLDLPSGEPVHIEVQWPPLVEHSLTDLVAAVQAIAALPGGHMPTLLRLLYQAVGVRDTEALIDQAAIDDDATLTEALRHVVEHLQQA